MNEKRCNSASFMSEPTKSVCKSLVNAATTPKRTEKADITGSMKTDAAFAMPESLSHNFVVVPSKLRLTTLATFLLSKCRVSLVCIVQLLIITCY